jgi:hypothetical protein
MLPFTQGIYVLLAHPLVLIKGSMGLELIEPVLGSYLPSPGKEPRQIA